MISNYVGLVLKFVPALGRAFKRAFLWDRALVRASRGEHSAAMEYVRRIYALRGEQVPSVRVRYYENTLTAHLACRLGDYDLAVAASRTVLNQLNLDVRGLSEFDKDYLRYYCKTIMEHCSYRLNLSVFQESREIRLRYRDLQFDKVRPHLKEKFPVLQPVESELLEEKYEARRH